MGVKSVVEGNSAGVVGEDSVGVMGVVGGDSVGVMGVVGGDSVGVMGVVVVRLELGD